MLKKVVKKPLAKKVVAKKESVSASRALNTNSNISPRTGKPVRAYNKNKNTETNKASTTKNNVVVKKPVSKKISVSKKSVSTGTTITKATHERTFDALTGFAVGSDQHIIAEALLAGGETRQEITDALRKKLDPTTKTGTPKPVANIVSSVFNKMVSNGFVLESSFRLSPPTPASKRKATRLRNAK